MPETTPPGGSGNYDKPAPGGGGFNGGGSGIGSGETNSCGYVCDGPPSDNCTAFGAPYGCCPLYACNGSPTNCTSKNGTIYNLYDGWDEGCQNCYCAYSYWEYTVYTSCYNFYCPRKPHKDCVVNGTDSRGCCKEYFCDNTTCISERGQYYAIGETWSPADEPCKRCSCHADGNVTRTECVTRKCANPPGPNCRPLIRQFQCCPYDWDCSDSYLITTPKKWIRGQEASICVFLLGSPDIRLNFSLKGDSDVVSQVILEQTAASGYHCVNVTVPSNISYTAGLEISGEINSAAISEKRDLIPVSLMETFIQTDKYMYMPGQLVQFRILTITGTKALVSHDDIPEIWIVSPKGSRLAQWKNVPNPVGLLQLDFQLAEEVEEGTYQIFVRTEETSGSQSFKVEEYVLPRFSLTIQPPPYVLATASEIVFSVCANYTYGQPVNGTLTLSVDRTDFPYYYYYYNPYYLPTPAPPVNKTFSGCDEVIIATADIGYVGYQVPVKGSFVEEGTGNVMTATASVEVKYQSSSLETITTEDYWKPGLPYNFRVKVTKLGSSTPEGEIVTICVGYDSSCKNYTADGSGIINAFIPPHIFGDSSYVYIRAETLGGYEQGNLGSLYSDYASAYPNKFFSASQSSLSLGLLPKSHKCSTGGDTITIPVMFVANDTSSIVLHIQVFSRGQITYTGEEVQELTANDLPISESDLLEPLQPLNDSSLIRGYFNIKIPLGPLTSPYLKVLIWYSRSDGEVISASASADVSKCLRNPTSLRWETKSDALPSPKDDVSLILSSAPSSVCGLGVVDESVELLSGGQRGTPTLETIFQLFGEAEVSAWDNPQVNDNLYCNGNGGNSYNDYDYGTAAPVSRKRSVYGYSNFIDALKSFDDAGVYAISDLTLETRPCHYSYYYYYDYVYPDYGDVVEGGNTVTENGVGDTASADEPMSTGAETLPPTPAPEIALATAGPAPGAAPAPAPGAAPGGASKPDYANEGADKVESPGKIELERTYFPETWLWEIVVVSQSGETAKEVQLPDTVTKWVGEAVCLHPELGIGLSPKSSITSFVPFFLDLSHPATARRHEKIPILVSVFNYLTTSLPVTVELLTSAEYTAQTYSTKTCVSGNGKEVVKFVVVPLEAGDVNLTFSASIDTADGSCGGTVDVGRSDTVIRPLKVKFEGVTKRSTHGHYLCGDESAFTWPVESHPGTVNGSDKIFVSASADLLGPTLENLGNLIQMPYGCGEQNMLNFAPNIYVMRYLASSGQLTPSVEAQLLNYMKTGYQQELLYQHTDGSFSAFGESDSSGSTWLTAFVLKSFSQADSYITVDENLLLSSKNWLLSLQNGDGCFQSVGFVIHTDMKGGVEDSGASLAPLTAYVLISLLEGNLTEDVQVIANAVTCISANTSNSTYVKALTAYALSLAGESNATALISDVYNTLTTDSSGLSQALTVEAAGYLLLAMLNENPGSYANWASDIAKHINLSHNGQRRLRLYTGHSGCFAIFRSLWRSLPTFRNSSYLISNCFRSVI
ncbi:alpha-1-inhibitor 3-like [Macrobrachium rosenbergii]|uniref:alpha-1-inhibitor 3-like n=1 Tax=Macrobrachium rosenbergii TaxID=79674 RepID=UPI0034D66C6C